MVALEQEGVLHFIKQGSLLRIIWANVVLTSSQDLMALLSQLDANPVISVKSNSIID